MCGILAQISFTSSIDPLVFNTMRDTMTHRGPDGAGSHFFNDNKVALGHRRLSIIDLTEAGKQPMCNEDENLWLTFNGEIYNYKNLRKELEAKGHKFASNTDSEVLLHGYEEWGADLVDRLKGMFAFCIWNKDDNSLFLVRDRFGIKPLCYYQDKKTFIAASELKAIVTSPSVPKALNIKALSDFLVFRYVPSPHCIWKGIQKLPPATCMMIEADGSNRQWEYWKPKYGQKLIAEPEAIEKLGHLLETSMNEHLISDTPIGLLLSGGMDSSAIAYYLHKKGLRPNTFSVGFINKNFSEHLDARVVSEEFETMHHELLLEDEFSTLVDKLSYFFDEPLGGTAFMPTYLVSKLASQHVKVVLGGHGGDEVFAGYDWFHQLYRDWYLRTPSKIKRLFKGNQQFFLEKAFQVRSIADWHYKDIELLIHPDLFAQMKSQKDDHLFLKYYDRSMSPIKNAQAIDLSLFNNEFGVSFLDKASMANSVEARVPLLDHELVEFMLEMDEKVYYKYNQNKYILKQLITPHLPTEILNKPKSGFGFKIKKFIPISQMEVEIRASRCYSSSALFNNAYIDQLFYKQDFRKMWCLYIFCKWFDCWDNKVGIQF